MHRLAAFALVAGCSSPRTIQPLALGEPPSFEMALSLHPNVPFAIADTSDAELARAATAFVEAHLAPLQGDDVLFDGAVVDADLISIALRQQYHGLPVVGGQLGLVIKHGHVILAHGTLREVPDLETAPHLAMHGAIETVRDGLPAPHPGDRDASRLVVYGDRLAWEVSA